MARAKRALCIVLVFKKVENDKNKLKIKSIRKEPFYRGSEKQQNKEKMKVIREKTLYRESEKKENKERIKISREKLLYRESEREKNILRMKVIRKNKSYKINEQIKNRNKMQILRTLKEDLNYNVKEKINDSERKRLLRLDNFFRYRENYSNFVRNKLNSDIKDNKYYQNVVIINFIQNRQLGPDIVCVCCENLFFWKTVERFDITKTKNKLSQRKIAIDDFLKQIVNNSSEFICKTCKKYITLGEIPKTASNVDLKFPNVPAVVTNLTALEERMVSSYIYSVHANKSIATVCT